MKIQAWIRITTLSILFSMLAPALLFSQETTESVYFKVRTSSPGGNYAPKNIGAIWIEDASGNFVRTLELWANKRKQYLYTWNQKSSSNTTDAVTSATMGSHQTHEATWNLKDASGNRVADGNYTLRIEMTDKHAQGPLASYTFPVGQASSSLSLTDATYFHDLVLNWTSVSTGIAESSLLQPALELYQNYPNPFNPTTEISYSLPTASTVKLTIYNTNGALIKTLVNGYESSGKHSVKFDASGLPSGMYLYKITTEKFSLVRKMLLSK